MSKFCQVTRKTNIFGKQISHSNKKSRRIFKANIFRKRLFIINKNKWITIFLSNKGLKTLNKNFFKSKNIYLYEK
ncbi:50S ribosomal subunit protein L28 [Candidatus Karelsulcia muelleri]|uniref:50S ribosomal protein L28 n=1 Tax=Candidatus Karelsulcia muelleri TaxID=336810 RepID=UPI001FF29C5E|nr:50S ribosomal protein L28 [Candidatus Karelsulcia muelleri]UOQ27743.1 50S ribosomal subunit protein L28 [Candidatus Karelsulcia muelleri]UOQ32959.1 50S ribosomal subunit protein L28 [Candidatus Karelsulcia muelleri]